MQPRQRAYLDILTRGLPMLRNMARGGRVTLCEIEAEHLHEIPALMGESNEYAHQYYIVEMRGRYVQHLRRIEATEYLESAMIWYAEPWRILASIAGVELTD